MSKSCDMKIETGYTTKTKIIVKQELFFNEKTDVPPPLLGIKKITKLHLVMLQGDLFKNIYARVMVLMHDTSE